jgi:hypothetical protein
VYNASNRRLYRFAAGAGGRPRAVWQVRYPNSRLHKLGQVDDGTGTTPTVMPGGLVSITDNADPMDVVVYRRARHVRGPRAVCIQPVFRRGASATDNSLIAAGRAMIVENNYGYSVPAATMNGKTTAPGLERVDLNRGGHGCHRVWNSDEISPTVVPKLSLNAGLVYAYTKPPRADGNDAWYLTALSFRSGRTAWKRLSGTGLGHNNNYAPVTLGPDGAAYVGVLGGLVRLEDAVRPRLPRAHLFMRLRYRRGPGRCANSDVAAAIVGRDAGSADSARFQQDGRQVGTDRRRPLRHVFRRGALPVRHTAVIGARVALFDGRRVTLHRRIRPCG